MKRLFFYSVTCILFSLSTQAQEAPIVNQNTIGVGLGIPYGILGFNVDVNIAPNVNFTGGIGTAVVGVGYNLGFKYFFADASKSLRPRVLAVYGTNSILQVTNASSFDKAYTGLSLGGGVQYMWGESQTSGVDFDIIYIATSGLDVNDLKNQGIIVEEPSKIKISIGYRYTL
jgi:hypothetical protein